MNFAPKRAACPSAVDTNDFKGPDGLCVYTAASGLKDEKKYKRRRTLTRQLMTVSVLSFAYLNDLRVNFFYNEVYYKSLRVKLYSNKLFQTIKISIKMLYTSISSQYFIKSFLYKELRSVCTFPMHDSGYFAKFRSLFLDN